MDLYDSVQNLEVRKEFLDGLAELCLKPPFSEWWQRVSRQHLALAKEVEPLARREVQALGGRGSVDQVVKLLMIAERAERDHSSENTPSIFDLVRANKELNQALFWADVTELRANGREDSKHPIRIWQVHTNGPAFWAIDASDLPWLFEDFVSQTSEEDRRIILSAIATIFIREGRLESEAPKLKELIGEASVLLADLNEYLSPPLPDPHVHRHEMEMEKQRQAHEKEEEEAKASWVRFGDYVRAHLDQLRDPSAVSSWKTGAFRLYHLSQWLGHRTGREDDNAHRQWRLLEEGFGREVAEAYRDGMKALWRGIKPERPKRREGGGVTVKHTTILAFNGVGIEAAEDPEWTSHLSEGEARTAALHGCLSEQGIPDWIDDLIVSHPQVVLPILKRVIKQEWSAPGPGRADFLYRFAGSDVPIQPTVQQILFEIVCGTEPDDLTKLDNGFRIIRRIDLDMNQTGQLVKIARRRLHHHEKKGKVDSSLRYLGLLLAIDSDKAIIDLSAWLAKPMRKDRTERAERTLAYLFDRHNPVVPNPLSNLSVLGLEKLLRTAYSYVRPEDDAVHEGSYSPNQRDHAENARNTILSAILNRPGSDAYQALQRVALDPSYSLRKERFQELARGKAERDSELPVWDANEVVSFEQNHTAPVKTGDDLLNVVMAVLSDIQLQMDKGDVTSRPLLQRAQDEDEVRNWVVEQMNFRSRGRFHAYREAQVADKDRPDVIIASTTAPCEVGMEVKHGEKKWTLRQLDKALKVQLGNNYLKPASRRHGVFVISNHGPRRWRDPETKQFMDFKKLLALLTTTAKTILKNETGPIEIRCFGIDASGSSAERNIP